MIAFASFENTLHADAVPKGPHALAAGGLAQRFQCARDLRSTGPCGRGRYGGRPTGSSAGQYQAADRQGRPLSRPEPAEQIATQPDSATTRGRRRPPGILANTPLGHRSPGSDVALNFWPIPSAHGIGGEGVAVLWMEWSASLWVPRRFPSDPWAIGNRLTAPCRVFSNSFCSIEHGPRNGWVPASTWKLDTALAFAIGRPCGGPSDPNGCGAGPPFRASL